MSPGSHGRGVVVKVYTCPELSISNADRTGANTSRSNLYNYELGNFGKYFN
jgi:hypothetical protein